MNFKVNIPEHQIGDIIKAKIVSITSDGVLVDIGLKTEGIILLNEFSRTGIPDDFVEGKEIQVLLLPGKTFGYQNVSYNQARQRISWEHIINCFEKSEPVSGKIVKKVRGGYIVDIGIDAFLPESQYTKNDTEEVKMLITKLNKAKKTAVVSQKKFIKFEKEQLAEKFFSSVAVGDVLKGKVSAICNFGVFVDLGGVEGLVHISDLAWYRVNKPEDIVKLGDVLELKVLAIDKQNKKISLGLKQLLPHPWEKAEEKYPPGSEVEGKITGITNFGAFVELEPGLKGLLHISEVSWVNKDINLKDKLKVNEKYKFKVLEVNSKEQRLALSLKRMLENPWEKFRNEYPPGTKLKCKVIKLLPFGVLVELPGGLEGLVHVEDMSWMKKIRHPKEIVNAGDEIDVVLLEVKPEEEKAILSIKHLTEDPFEKFSAGKVIKGIVSRIVKNGAWIKLNNEVEAFLHKFEISNDKTKSIEDVVTIGKEVEAKVIRSDRVTKKIELSIKKLELDRERELIEKYSTVARPQLGEVLEEKER